MKNRSEPKLFLLAGSVSRSSHPGAVDRAHEFVREVTKRILSAGNGFVVFVAAEPVNDAGQSLVH